MKKKYISEVLPAMKKEFGYKQDIQVPKIQKVILNSGVGKIVKDDKMVNWCVRGLTDIAGQKAVLTKAKKSIAAFKTREGMPIGVKVSLRRNKLYDFMERLVSVALPRTRDFRGISKKSIDKNGNLTIGIRESIVFPEVSHEKAGHIFGFEATFVTNVRDAKEAERLFILLGFPIKS